MSLARKRKRAHSSSPFRGCCLWIRSDVQTHIWPILRGSSISGTHYAQRTRRAHLNYFTASNVADRLNYNCTAEHGTSFVAQSISFTSWNVANCWRLKTLIHKVYEIKGEIASMFIYLDIQQRFEMCRFCFSIAAHLLIPTTFFPIFAPAPRW